jgi:peroxiredoxin (alkyl hydroperoxide reductase subunit C)
MPGLDELAPDFVAETNQGKLALSDLRGKWVVLFAYPADFTPICEMDILGFARNKPTFDGLGVQFVGWSVDSAESHEKWVKDVKEKTGVLVDYPLIADVDKKLAERYGILHKTKGVTYRAIFIIDPDGILQFSADYTLDVGRSVKEVERVIKVLQRARELGHLNEMERARELSEYNEQSLAEPKRRDEIEEGKRIVEEGNKDKVVLRLIGGLAIRYHCHGRHSAHLRNYHDIDLFGLSKDSKNIASVLEKMGYHANMSYNTLHGGTRLQFVSTDYGKEVDVFLNKFHMQHTLDFSQRIQLDEYTIPITDLLLTKLQMEGRMEEKDAKDIVAILEDHQIGNKDDKETLNVGYVSDLCCRDWGLHKTVTGNLQRIRQFIEAGTFVQCVGMEASELVGKVDVISDSLISSEKGLRWRARNMIGERMKWYEVVRD